MHPDEQLRGRLRGGQAPKAVVLTCSDSRLPPELIFDQARNLSLHLSVCCFVRLAPAAGCVQHWRVQSARPVGMTRRRLAVQVQLCAPGLAAACGKALRGCTALPFAMVLRPRLKLVCHMLRVQPLIVLLCCRRALAACLWCGGRHSLPPID